MELRIYHLDEITDLFLDTDDAGDYFCNVAKLRRIWAEA